MPSVIAGFFCRAKEQNGGLEDDSLAEDFALDGFEFVDALYDAKAESGDGTAINICAGESQDGDFAIWKKATEQSPINQPAARESDLCAATQGLEGNDIHSDAPRAVSSTGESHAN